LLSTRRFFRASIALCFVIVTLGKPQVFRAQSTASLADRIQKVMNRPEFAHANFGIEFYSLETGKVIYSLNADKLLSPPHD
jgi:D-alanyl-D-alanine carboxypeptidase